MQAIDEDEGYDDTENEVMPSSILDRYVSGDDLGDSFSIIKNCVNEKGWVDAIYEREENEEHKEEEDCSSLEGPENNEDDQEGTDDDNASDGSAAKGVEYVDLSAIHVWRQSDADDDIGFEEGQELDEKKMTKSNIDVPRADSVICHKREVNEKCAQGHKGLPYVIEAPKTLTEICSLLDNRSDVEVVEIIRRIRTYNSISLGAENRRKMQVSKESQKFYPKVICFFQMLLMYSMERNSKIDQLSQCNMEIKVSNPWLRIHDEGCTVHQIDLFTVLGLQDDSPYFLPDNFSRASILSIVVKIWIEFVNMYQGLSSFPKIFFPIAAMLDEVLQGAKLPRNLHENMEEVADLIRKQASKHQLSRQPLQMRKQRPEPIKLMNPNFEENFVKGIDYDPDCERAQRKKLKKLLKKEAKGVVCELCKDNHFIFELKTRDKILQEEERSENYGKALAFLQE